jgi:flagellar biosynthesis protein FliP
MSHRSHGGTAHPSWCRHTRRWVVALIAFLCASPVLHADDRPAPAGADSNRQPAAVSAGRADVQANQPAELESNDDSRMPGLDRLAVSRSIQTVALFGLVSLAPVGLLMLTGFVRISIVLTLLRQALGSPQVPGNQIITALSLLLTTLVMWPYGEAIYREAVSPYAAGQLTAGAAWDAGSRPIKAYMIKQLKWTRHEDYLDTLYEYAAPSSPGQAKPAPERPEDFPFRVVAPAFLLSELTTGLMMGFYIYLPFLVVDLVVSAVLAATGLFMLPPALVAFPVKLILFVLADGCMLVSTMLLRSFGAAGIGP